MSITLYTTHCPKCEILKKKLIAKNITFIEVDDIEIMLSKNYLAAPMLTVGNEEYNFSEANNWVNTLE